MKTVAAYVYNPDDEEDYRDFNGKRFIFPPNGTLRLVSPWPDITVDDIVAHILQELGPWGVCRTSGPVKDGKATHAIDDEVVAAAEVIYLKATMKWAFEILKEYGKRAQDFHSQGLPGPETTPDEAKAQAWWEKYRDRCAAAGLVH